MGQSISTETEDFEFADFEMSSVDFHEATMEDPLGGLLNDVVNPSSDNGRSLWRATDA